MSDTKEDLDRTFALIHQELEAETQKSREQKNNQNDALKDREQAVQDCLARAKNHYLKKEWGRAFSEWGKVCAFLPEQDEFRKKIDFLKESHENLAKVNREVAEIKTILNQRSSPPAADRKFVQEAHDKTNGQIKNVYGYLNQQLRTERTPKTLSFWWPVLIAVVLLGTGYAGLSAHYSKARRDLGKQTEKTSVESLTELTALQAQRDELLKKTGDLKQDYENKIEELKQQNEGWRNAGREKVESLEVHAQQLETENKDLKRQVETLIQDSLNRQT